MRSLRVSSIQGPLSSRPRTVTSALRLLGQLEFVGKLPAELASGELTLERIRSVLDVLATEHVGAANASSFFMFLEPSTDEDSDAVLRQALDQLAQSPMPDSEWTPLRDALGDELLSQLVDASTSSLRRYAAGERKTPDDVAGRLHAVALLTADLAGGYNEYGVRRWFTRPRQPLDGRSPLQVLSGGFDPDGPAVGRVRELAAWLVGAGSAA